MKKATDFLFNTAEQENLCLSEKVQEADKTLLIFSRYLGCPLCQVDILEFCDQYERFREKDTQILLVLQSSAETIRNQTLVDKIPFTVICDPEAKLYELYDVKTAKKALQMINPFDLKLWRKAKKMMKNKLKHGTYEGNEQQLPAMFLLNRDMDLLYSHHAKSISDLPDTDEILKLL